MLYLIPARLHRAAMPLGYVLWRAYIRIVRPDVASVSVFIEDDEGRILLIRQSYGTRDWTMPAGGTKRNEDPELAIRREVQEELSCELHTLELLRHAEESVFGAPHRASIFRARAASEPVADRREVVEVRWFALDDLPDNLTSVTRRRLELLQQG
ncbi:NUDIX domain-containing protein [Aurantiacibacter gilvus]|uniref:NUDIX domain-containing protein n=1 Tax=Aurantiacibacter gilvus TaxID=3139141 RepID=A0ABU9IH77_9SPHN